MRALFKAAMFGLLASGLWASPQIGDAQELIPPKRLILSENTDLPGGDITSIFDTTLEACERACLSNKSCLAFTFNTKNGSCFPKSSVGEAASYQGAYSGEVLTAAKGAEALAKVRRPELAFLPDYEIDSVREQASGLANMHVTNGFSVGEHMAAAAEAESRGDLDGASRFAGAAVNLADSADAWQEYARLLQAAGRANGNNQSDYRQRGFYASANAYLRANNKAQQHTILVTMGELLESLGRGRDTVQALRLAQSLQPRDDTAKALDAAIAKYGFRIEDTQVQADSVRPKICVTFTEDLAKVGVNYSDYVKLPAAGLTVTSDGYRQLCVEGVEHGSRQTITFREGLPAADGQSLAKSVDITAYVRDRTPAVRFPAVGNGGGHALGRAMHLHEILQRIARTAPRDRKRLASPS